MHQQKDLAARLFEEVADIKMGNELVEEARTSLMHELKFGVPALLKDPVVALLRQYCQETGALIPCATMRGFRHEMANGSSLSFQRALVLTGEGFFMTQRETDGYGDKRIEDMQWQKLVPAARRNPFLTLVLTKAAIGDLMERTISVETIRDSLYAAASALVDKK